MRPGRALLLVGWPAIPAVVVTLLLANSDTIPITCLTTGVGFDRPIYSTCVRTLFWATTGPDPLRVGLSWGLVGVAIYLGLLGWSVLSQRRWSGAWSIAGFRGVALLVLPVLPAVGVVAFLMGGDGIVHFCGDDLLFTNTCLPTPFHELTGSRPTVIWITWIAVGALTYIALLGWPLLVASRLDRSRG
jgi:hypothetical protein